MKRINQYYYGGCIAFTAITIITMLMHILNAQTTIQVKSLIFTFFIILLIQVVLYFMENLQIKSQIVHIVLELLVTFIATFSLGVLTKFITIYSLNSTMEIILSIIVTYGVTTLSLYNSGQNDAMDINNQLSNKK